VISVHGSLLSLIDSITALIFSVRNLNIKMILAFVVDFQEAVEMCQSAALDYFQPDLLRRVARNIIHLCITEYGYLHVVLSADLEARLALGDAL
jgi:hypothetical protein